VNVGLLAAFFFCMGIFTWSRAWGAPVTREEAVSAADLWYAMEVNSRHSKLDTEQKSARIKNIPNRQVLAIDDQYAVSATPLAAGKALAYIIRYQPSGFVVVSGDDRLDPVLVHGAESTFTWESPDRNFLRYFVTKTLTDAEQCLHHWETNGAELAPHEMWMSLRRKLQEGVSLDKAAFGDLPRPTPGQLSLEPSPMSPEVFVLMDTATWDQMGFYNDECVVNNGSNNVPTGCVATGAAIKMRYHMWPPSGVGDHSYSDTDGTIQFSHAVTFSSWNYNWANMPTNRLTSANADVAKIMYHCGVMVDMDYELLGSAAQTPDIDRANQYFRYRGAVGKYSYDKDGIIESIRAYLPVNVGGGGHSVVIDGYRDTPSEQFHVNVGWDGMCNAWYTAGIMPTGTCNTAAIEKCVPYMAPDIYRYVDGEWRPFPDGSLHYAFPTLDMALLFVPTGGQIWLKAGTYAAPATITNAVTLKAYYQGAVTLTR
jgi:hypothetical protein